MLSLNHFCKWLYQSVVLGFYPSTVESLLAIKVAVKAHEPHVKTCGCWNPWYLKFYKNIERSCNRYDAQGLSIYWKSLFIVTGIFYIAHDIGG